eukprot:4972392-Prymnesium_polylepis.1
MAAKNKEVEEAMKDLVDLVLRYKLNHTSDTTDPEDIRKLAEQFSTQMYTAVLNCTKDSLLNLKNRVGSRSLTGFLFVEKPFFEVNVVLNVPNVVMEPPLIEIQDAINTATRAVLSCSKRLEMWENDAIEGQSMPRTVYEVVSRDREVVRTVMLLAGALEGVKRQVHEYLNTFAKYDYLWKDDKMKAYNAFMSNEPTLEDFETELKKYDMVQNEIQKIPEKHNIGALSLDTSPLKQALIKEARTWKD